MPYEPTEWIDKTATTPGTKINRQRMMKIENALAAALPLIGTYGELEAVTGTVDLPNSPSGTLVGYRVIDTATFLSHDLSQTITLPVGVYILENSPTGWVVHQAATGTSFVPALFADRFDSADGAAIHGRSMLGRTWKDLQSDSVWAPAVSVYVPSVISNGKIESVATKLRTGQVSVPVSTFEVSADIVHDGSNPGSGERSIKLGLSSALHGALVTNAGGSWVEGAYLFYEGGTGFMLMAGNHVFPAQVGSTYTGLGTGAVEANMAVGWDGSQVYAKVNGAVVAYGTPAGGALVGMSVAGYSLGLPAGWSIDNFVVRAV